MDPRARLALVAALLAVGGGVAALTSRGDGAPDPVASTTPGPFASQGTASPPPQCLQVPTERLETPDWSPDDLPMPSGSYVSEIPQAPEGAAILKWSVPLHIDRFVEFALKEWRDANGWELSGGDREAFEAEATASKGDITMAFRATALYCDQDWTQVIVATARLMTTSPTASGTPAGGSSGAGSGATGSTTIVN